MDERTRLAREFGERFAEGTFFMTERRYIPLLTASLRVAGRPLVVFHRLDSRPPGVMLGLSCP